MRIGRSAVFVCAFSAVAFAQGGAGTIAGKVTDPNGKAVTIGSITAKNTATEAVVKSAVSGRGDYTVGPLPPGTYDLGFAAPGNMYVPYARKDVKVQAGATLQLDIQLQWGAILGTLGDDPVGVLNAIRAKANVPKGPTPRMADGKPDLSGVWANVADENPPPPLPLLPWARAIEKERTENNRKASPQSRCLPGTPIQIMANFPYKFVQSRSVIVMLEDFDVPGVRQIFLDGRGLPEDWNPAWLGHSTGKWDNDTLVVDTTGFNDSSWILNAPHTEQLHVTERIRRPDLGRLEIDITAEDPGAFSGSWKRHVSATLAGKDEEILEYICNENNKDVQHMVGK